MTGATKIRLSNLSRTPPCPGMIFEESFTSQYLLIRDSNKSPTCEKIPTRIPNMAASGKDNLSGKIRCTSKEIITVKRNPAAEPSHVFFGLIADSGCLPKNLPPK